MKKIKRLSVRRKTRPKLKCKGSGLEKWLKDQGAVESVKFDEDTGRPMRTFTIKI